MTAADPSVPAPEAAGCANCGHGEHAGRCRVELPVIGLRCNCPVFVPAPAAPPPAAPPEQEQRAREGNTLHDGAIYDPSGCPRGLTDCQPLARYASPGAESYMCCGQTSSAPVPTDRLRLCIRSTHKAGVDILVNMDERDVVHTSAVLMGGLASLGSVKIIAHDSGEGYDAD